MSEKLDKFIKDCTSKEILDIYHFFTNEQIEILEKLDLKLENKKYTIYEFDILDGNIRKYFKSQDILNQKGISEKEYDLLLKVLNKIAEEYKL